MSDVKREKCSFYCVKSVSFSDHGFVAVTLGHKTRRKSGFNWNLWKFNTRLLKDEKSVKSIRELLTKVKEGDLRSAFEEWKISKEEVRIKAIKRSSGIMFAMRAEEDILQRQRQILHIAECENPGNGIDDINFIKARLEKINYRRYPGAVVRSRLKRYLLDEQPTRHAFADEKRDAALQQITVIESSSGITTDKKEIEERFVEYYSDLFSDKVQPNNFHTFGSLLSEMPQISEGKKTLLEQPISLDEIKQADAQNARTRCDYIGIL